jgi:hypothetical protein
MDARKKRIQELLKKKKAEKANEQVPALLEEDASDGDEDVINGLAQTEKKYMDEEDAPLAEEARRPKHLLKHFRVLHSIDSFFTGGNIQFCKDSQKIYSQYGSNIVRYHLGEKKVEYELSHVGPS